MIIDILKNNTYLGTLKFEENVPIFEGKCDEKLRKFVERSLKTGISCFRDVRIDSESSIIEEDVAKDDPLYTLAFTEWLKRHDYEVRQQHPEVDKEIHELAQKIPDDNPVKKQILKELGGMNYLEKTFILKKLKKHLA